MAQNFRYLNEMRMDEIENMVDSIFMLPLGISEGHGDHLPIGTDTFQAVYVCKKVAERLDRDVVLAPVLNYGHCRATKNLPGTISISFDTLRDIVYEILECAVEQGFHKFVLISGHAGRTHMTALRLACEKILSKDDIDILLLTDYDFAYELKGKDVPDTDGHGGEIETSRILHIRPDLVGENRPVSEVRYPRFKVIKDYSDYLVKGMRGDSSKATREEGEKIDKYVIDGIIEHIERELL